MSEVKDRNAGYSASLKDVMKLRGEPVAIKLIREGEDFPDGYTKPESQMSHCQAIFRARDNREYVTLKPEDESCKVGASAMALVDTPEKVMNGEFHMNLGAHDTPEAASKMIRDRVDLGFRSTGEVVCPLKDADFEPDVVIIGDIPERIYWVIPLATAEEGGRMQFSAAPFQCTCEDMTAIPIVTGRANISLGCYGCRRRTSMKPDELVAGIPYRLIPGFVERLENKYRDGIMAKAKRD